MSYEEKTMYMQEDGFTQIYVMYDHGWDVYYKRDGYPLLYAFGLSAMALSDVFTIAWQNVNQYEDLFN